MRTTLQTMTQTGTGAGAKPPPVEVRDPTLTRITRMPPSPRLSLLGRTMPSVSGSFKHLIFPFYYICLHTIWFSPAISHFTTYCLHTIWFSPAIFDKAYINPLSSFQDTIEITVALLADPSFCKWTLKQSVPVVFVYVEIEDGILFRLPLSDPWGVDRPAVNWVLVYTCRHPASHTSTRAWTNTAQSSFASSKSVVSS